MQKKGKKKKLKWPLQMAFFVRKLNYSSFTIVYDKKKEAIHNTEEAGDSKCLTCLPEIWPVIAAAQQIVRYWLAKKEECKKDNVHGKL